MISVEKKFSISHPYVLLAYKACRSLFIDSYIVFLSQQYSMPFSYVGDWMEQEVIFLD